MGKKTDNRVTEIEGHEPNPLYVPLDTSMTISTGSTLLDLNISGDRVRGGGLPGGIIVEIFGPPSSGKSALLVEICASVQAQKGAVLIADPEARLDKAYAQLFGLKIPDKIYYRPDTVSDLTDLIENWEPKNQKVMNILAADSLAAFSTEMEMTEGDKRGQRKAKELSEMCRVVGRKIAHGHQLIVLTNQERQGQYGKTTPGGFAVPFHASLRIRIARKERIEIKRKRKIKDDNQKSGYREVEMIGTLGIQSEALIVKSSISTDYRKAPIYIINRHGIDDVRANLTYLKHTHGMSIFPCVNKEYAYINQAIQYVENNNLEAELRENVIDTWEEVNKLLTIKRKKKVRF